MSKRPWYKPTVLEALVLLGIVALVLSIVLPSLHRARQTTGRQPCPSNLSRIGMALLLYANANGSRYPSSLEILVSAEDLPADVLRCPTTPGDPPYLFAAAGMREPELEESTIVCFEPVQNHDGDGSNVLFGDGHVEWMDARVMDQVRSKFDAGLRPITLDPRQPLSSPASRPAGRSQDPQLTPPVAVPAPAP